MDQQNKLLAMLQSATSPPPPVSSSSPHGSINSSSTHQSNQYLTASNLGSAGSPREPSPSPPPPSLQAVSLLDLFKNIGSPPPPPPPSAPADVVAPVLSQDDQKNKLLGMLNLIGQPSPNAGVTSPPSGSGVGTPVNSGDKDPLAVFRASHPAHSPASPTGQEPVINHPTGLTSPSTKTFPQVQAQHTGTSNTSSQGRQPKVEEKPAAVAVAPGSAPPTQAHEALKKGMFHFDSPFDAFTQPPRSRQTSSAQAPSQSQSTVKSAVAKSNLSDEQSLNKVKSIEKLPTSGRGSPQRVQSEKKAYTPPPTNVESVPVHELTPAEIDDQIKNTWQIGGIIKDAKGQGPKALTSHTIIDISKPNIESLVNIPDAVQVSPTTLMRTDNLEFKKGRRVGVTNTYIAYSMSKGRVRLIDSSSGARLVLQLPAAASLGPVVDMACSVNYMASIGWDRSIIVHKLPIGWKKDDPKVEMIFHCSGTDVSLGSPNKLEWVKREGKDWLAIAGREGVIVIDPTAQGKTSTLEELCKHNKVLIAEGGIVDFCLNLTHQVIGILSTTSHCTLYNVSNLNRVWHRPLPCGWAESEPTSIQFCESNLLIGRAQNTYFDLVQITVDLAALSTIKLIAPSPCPQQLHYSHAVYDSSNSTLYIAPFARGSLYAFKYALKGQQPTKDVSKPDGPTIVAFDRVAEYPLEPIISLALAKKGADEESEILYATPQGFSQAMITRKANDVLSQQNGNVGASVPTTVPSNVSSGKAVPSPKSPRGGKIELPKSRAAALPKSTSKNGSPAAVKTELPSASEDEAPSQARPVTQPRKGSVAPASTNAADGEPNAGASLSQDDLNKALKKTEDRLSNHLKQLVKNEITALNVRFDGLTGPDFASDISARVERSIKGSLNTTITQEIKKTVIPAATATIQNELRTVTSNQVPAAIYDALQTVPKELERSLAPLVQRTISNLVANAMDKAVQEAIQHSLLPALTQASSSVVEQLSAEMRSEMLQIRKELSPPSKEGQLANDHLLKSMSTSIADLQKQIATLSEQMKSASIPSHGPNGMVSPSVSGFVPPPPPSHGLPPHIPQPPPPSHLSPQPSSTSHPPSGPTQPTGPTSSQLEDTFLSALGAQTTSSTLQLVADHLALTDYCLPTNGKSPLSQAVLLTLLHRLAIVLSEIPGSHSMFAQVAGWERRTAILIDPKDQNIAGYIARVLSVVQGQLNTVLNNLQRYPDQNTQSHLVAIRGVMDIIAHKMVA
ncbi:uncharacterized protein I303_107405 [Kwoniella dejecticola CBS 10117]|uniref:Uncharacterized protein n=1 Tax=Kwoniella dejecticola CBS 10117 TaxID=1296121 RepID=A0A1A5ZZM1_9TREE|nr:uncharacterized protein I303_06809 [Kwoniella dejecticola CBS 10117]OBR83248.1 hypothetical protein I303_06809 [Kwoniella dejecticola CBS 10117]